MDDQTELGPVGRGGGTGERGEPGAAVKRLKVQSGWVTKMFGLYREEPLGEGQSSPWAGEFRVLDGVF